MDPDWQQVFFGRSEEVHQLAELLRSPAEHANGAVLLADPAGPQRRLLIVIEQFEELPHRIGGFRT